MRKAGNESLCNVSFLLSSAIDLQTVGALYYAVQVTSLLDSNRLAVILIRIRIRPNLRSCNNVQIVTVKFAVDLGSCLRWGKPTVAVTDVFQLKIYWAKVKSCFVRVR